MLARHSGVVVTLIVGAAVAFGLVGVPADRLQGDAQRIMYVHVPAAWLAYLAFFVTFIGSLGYMLRRDLRFDRLAASSAELGLLLTGAVIASGALWGKVTWGIWWDWDPRLTTTAVMFVVYAGYVLLRMSIVERVRRARLAAVLGIIGFANVPVVHLSVLWWRGLHQPPTVLRPGSPTIAPILLATLLANVIAFTLAYAWLLRRRIALETARDAAQTRLDSAR
ncbi:MAG: heme exporter protein [Chloroflexota bacterium]|nr:heme exporter protein [Chloroflexota bacterium]